MSSGSTLVDLRGNCTSVRDQGLRPTCLAFATSTAHESARRLTEYLSPEGLFRDCKRRDGLPLTTGTTVPAVVAALSQDGQALEASWPYGNANPIDPNAPRHHAQATQAGQQLLSFIVDRLAAAILVVSGLQLTGAWYVVKSDGIIPDPAANDQLLGGHAVVAVGYDPGIRRLLIRNSWGVTWGMGGYAWLPYAHIEKYGISAFTVDPSPSQTQKPAGQKSE